MVSPTKEKHLGNNGKHGKTASATSDGSDPGIPKEPKPQFMECLKTIVFPGTFTLCHQRLGLIGNRSKTTPHSRAPA